MKFFHRLSAIGVLAFVCGNALADESIEAQVINARITRDALKTEIAQIDSETTRCKKQKSGWTTATVIGGVGVVGTGIGAIVQNSQIQKKKKEISKLESEIQETKGIQ